VASGPAACGARPCSSATHGSTQDPAASRLFDLRRRSLLRRSPPLWAVFRVKTSAAYVGLSATAGAVHGWFTELVASGRLGKCSGGRES
jgi:hypothetical protein